MQSCIELESYAIITFVGGDHNFSLQTRSIRGRVLVSGEHAKRLTSQTVSLCKQVVCCEVAQSEGSTNLKNVVPFRHTSAVPAALVRTETLRLIASSGQTFSYQLWGFAVGSNNVLSSYCEYSIGLWNVSSAF
jgi:hypothetical protein